MRHNQLRGGPGEGHPPGDNLVGHHPQRVQIAAPVHPTGLGLLWRNILRRTHKYAGAGQPLAVRLRRLGNTEVGQQHPAGHVQHHIVGLHIAVDGPLSVGEVEGAGHWVEEAHRIADPQGRLFFEDAVERTPVDILHRDEVQAVLLAHVIDRHDAGVAQARRRARLTGEALDELGIHTELYGQYLDRDRALEQRVYGAVDAGHAPAPDLGPDLVAAQPTPEEVGHCVGSFNAASCGWNNRRNPDVYLIRGRLGRPALFFV